MSKKFLIIILTLMVAAAATGFFIWRAQDTRAKAEKLEAQILKGLTVEEIGLILKSQAQGGAAAGIAATAETRQLFLKGMREYLALAAEARREGMADDETFKINVEYKKNLLLADLYQAKLSKEQGKNYTVPKEEMDAVWSDPANEKQFETDMETLRSIQIAVSKERSEEMVIPKLAGIALVKARDNWSRAKVLSDKAKADAEFLARPEVGLRIKVLEAGILSADYLRKHWKDVKATEQEIAAYLAAHPEYDLNKKREKAEQLLRRAQAGEDFSQLAAEYSEDRLTKSKGGLYEDVGKDTLWIEVENAALALEKNQIADKLIESHIGWHIVKLEDKKIKQEKDGSQTVKFSVRHIVLQNSFEEPGVANPDIPPPFLKAEEIAKNIIEREKRDKLVEEVSRRNQIALPEDFTVELPDASTAAPSPNAAANQNP